MRRKLFGDSVAPLFLYFRSCTLKSLLFNFHGQRRRLPQGSLASITQLNPTRLDILVMSKPNLAVYSRDGVCVIEGLDHRHSQRCGRDRLCDKLWQCPSWLLPSGDMSASRTTSKVAEENNFTTFLVSSPRNVDRFRCRSSSRRRPVPRGRQRNDQPEESPGILRPSSASVPSEVDCLERAREQM